MTLSTSEAHTLTRELQQRSKCYTVQGLCHDLAPTGGGRLIKVAYLLIVYLELNS